jgi:hypothetical protein
LVTCLWLFLFLLFPFVFTSDDPDEDEPELLLPSDKLKGFGLNFKLLDPDDPKELEFGLLKLELVFPELLDESDDDSEELDELDESESSLSLGFVDFDFDFDLAFFFTFIHFEGFSSSLGDFSFLITDQRKPPLGI